MAAIMPPSGTEIMAWGCQGSSGLNAVSRPPCAV